MKIKEIEKNNQMIGDFMEVDIEQLKIGAAYSNDLWSPLLKYDRSWDWLIPVVQKCYKIDDGENFNTLVDAVSTLDIESTYNAVVKFIKWYNNKEPSKFLCEICGCECKSYVYDADKDADVGKCCK